MISFPDLPYPCEIFGPRVVATMNPGGDFGKRELSPALRSRFTEVKSLSWRDPTVERRCVERMCHFR